ncbi:MAG TPA: hypothetical protein VHB46_04515 [Burkholderiales bacterium]|nr:hypothetical protein [Burkholderiales bacterium]
MTSGGKRESHPFEFSGAYTRRQGAQYIYAWFGSIYTEPTGYRWTAEVWRDGNVMGTLTGSLGKQGRASVPEAIPDVRDAICHCIEYLIDIDE